MGWTTPLLNGVELRHRSDQLNHQHQEIGYEENYYDRA